MTWLPHLLDGRFALAGLVFALVPILLHLWRRPPQRELPWATMEFLVVALQHQRRWLRWRELLVLASRMALLLFFGLALAGPYWTASSASGVGGDARRTLLIIDNSLSMSRTQLGVPLLKLAKQRALQLLDSLPDDAQVLVVPWCGSSRPLPGAPQSKTAARHALEQIESVDRSASARQVTRLLDQAGSAFPAGPPWTAIVCDRQRSNWLSADDSFFRRLAGATVAWIEPAHSGVANAWIERLDIQDGIADPATNSTILVDVQWSGVTVPAFTSVTVSVDGVSIGSRRVDLIAPSGRQRVAMPHRFGPSASAGAEALLEAAILEDALPLDNQRVALAPTPRGLPMVFVDSVGDREDPAQHILGATRALRRLIAAGSTASDDDASGAGLVTIRHVRPEQVDVALLADARVVVVAGVAATDSLAELLRQFVVQGGRLLLAAGGDGQDSFQPAAWNNAAWRDGQGVLPAPCLEAFLGAAPRDSTDALQPFFLDTGGLENQRLFQLPDTSQDQMRALFREPIFFKAVRLAEDAIVAGPESATDDPAARDRKVNASPQWLSWTQHTPAEEQVSAQQVAREFDASAVPGALQVLARYGDPDGTPFLVQRRLGQGRVMMLTTGLDDQWSTLSQCNAFLLLDRIMRELLRETLPGRSFAAQDRLVIPLPQWPQGESIRLHRPGVQETDLLVVGFVGQRASGVVVDQPLQRGLYRLTSSDRETRFTCYDSSSESDLTPLDEQGYTMMREAGVRLLESDDAWPTAPGSGRDLSWSWWLLCLALGAMAAELWLLGRSDKI